MGRAEDRKTTETSSYYQGRLYALTDDPQAQLYHGEGEGWKPSSFGPFSLGALTWVERESVLMPGNSVWDGKAGPFVAFSLVWLPVQTSWRLTSKLRLSVKQANWDDVREGAAYAERMWIKFQEVTSR